MKNLIFISILVSFFSGSVFEARQEKQKRKSDVGKVYKHQKKSKTSPKHSKPYKYCHDEFAVHNSVDFNLDCLKRRYERKVNLKYDLDNKLDPEVLGYPQRYKDAKRSCNA